MTDKMDQIDMQKALGDWLAGDGDDSNGGGILLKRPAAAIMKRPTLAMIEENPQQDPPEPELKKIKSTDEIDVQIHKAFLSFKFSSVLETLVFLVCLCLSLSVVGLERLALPRHC